MKTALLLIDIQNDYFPGGKMELSGSVEAGRRARRLLSSFRERQMPVIHIRHTSLRPGAFFFLPGTVGAEIHESLLPDPAEIVVDKNYPNSFRDTPLLDLLSKNDIEHLVLAGMMTHMCVDATARAAFDLGFSITLIHDACATRDLAFGSASVPAAHVHAAFLAALSGAYARVASTEDYIAGLEKPAD
ncbi:MAG: cysteine hydrolase [Desulfobacteraceae bacterium]|nr:cysteine hydrolase [Desulfobacteraceae bacterium]